ncbi:hexitol phosphatase HxpB [Actinobacillus vicugnae]|uniref:hexitol phosphatase HxpB n=1 Tax=Actinobacillus vicugnae TaxID=2573093 RepID=UPI00123FEBC2|nr:hexitol phosphatase HxpB [Actinobacillus vicugnae]
MKVTSVIFDMDGVIIDSEPQWAEAQIHTLAQLGIQITEHDCEQLTRGKRIDELAQVWIDRFQLKLDKQVFMQDILKHGSYAISQAGTALPGLYPLLDFLTQNHFRLALATSSPPMIIKAVFDRLDLWHYFPILCSAMDEEYGKPHPAVYLQAVKKLGVSGNECVVIEDSVTGMIAAKAANLTTFVVNPQAHQAKFAIADERLSSLFDVIKRLE